MQFKVQAINAESKLEVDLFLDGVNSISYRHTVHKQFLFAQKTRNHQN